MSRLNPQRAFQAFSPVLLSSYNVAQGAPAALFSYQNSVLAQGKGAARPESAAFGALRLAEQGGGFPRRSRGKSCAEVWGRACLGRAAERLGVGFACEKEGEGENRGGKAPLGRFRRAVTFIITKVGLLGGFAYCFMVATIKGVPLSALFQKKH